MSWRKRDTRSLPKLLVLSTIEDPPLTRIVRTCGRPELLEENVAANVLLNFLGLTTMSLYRNGVISRCKALQTRQRLFLSWLEVTCNAVSQAPVRR